MKRFFTFVLFCIPAIYSHSQNLATNPGFEVWQKINKPTGWTTALGCLKDSAVISSGTYSCKQSTTTESKEVGQLMPVTAGSQYRISFWYRNDPAGTGNGCRIWSNWKDADGNSISDETSLPLLHSGYLKSEIWIKYSVDVITPANASHFNLILRTLPNSVTYWDDIVFEESVPTFNIEFGYEDIRIYPNPANKYLTISNIQNVQHIDIQTFTGISIWTHSNLAEEVIMIPVSDFKDGVYIIRMSVNGRIIIRKFIKL